MPVTSKGFAKRAFMGLAKTGGIASNGSGDYVIAFSTDSSLRVPFNAPAILQQNVLSNDAVTPLFMAAIEATEEAIINSPACRRNHERKERQNCGSFTQRPFARVVEAIQAIRPVTG